MSTCAAVSATAFAGTSDCFSQSHARHLHCRSGDLRSKGQLHQSYLLRLDSSMARVNVRTLALPLNARPTGAIRAEMLRGRAALKRSSEDSTALDSPHYHGARRHVHGFMSDVSAVSRANVVMQQQSLCVRMHLQYVQVQSGRRTCPAPDITDIPCALTCSRRHHGLVIDLQQSSDLCRLASSVQNACQHPWHCHGVSSGSRFPCRRV